MAGPMRAPISQPPVGVTFTVRDWFPNNAGQRRRADVVCVCLEPIGLDREAVAVNLGSDDEPWVRWRHVECAS